MTDAERIAELEAQIAEARRVIVELDQLPTLHRYDNPNESIHVTVRKAIEERHRAACHWQQSAWQEADRRRKMCEAIDALMREA